MIAGFNRVKLAASHAMVGMAGEDSDTTVELLGDEDTHQLMRPGKTPEIEYEIGPFAQVRIETVGTTNHENHVTPPLVA